MEYVQIASTWLLGLLVSGGVFTVFAFWLFRLLGERWLDNRFSRNLEDLRHKQAGEIERFRFQVSTLLDRASKVHQREYEVLPELWDALIDADSYVQAAVGSFKSYPDVTFASAEALDEVLSSKELPETTKSEIRSKTGRDRQKALQRAIDFQTAVLSSKAYRNFRRLFLKHSIFIGEELKAPIEKYGNLLWEAQVEHELNLELDDVKPERIKKKKLQQLGEEQLAEVRDKIHRHLWRTDLPPADPQ